MKNSHFVTWSFLLLIALPIYVYADPSADALPPVKPVNVFSLQRVYCLVRYHGFDDVKYYKPGLSDHKNPFFDKYVEVGRNGDRGTSARLPFGPDPSNAQVLEFGPFSYTDSDFGLVFNVNSAVRISADAMQASGALQLTITDIQGLRLIDPVSVDTQAFRSTTPFGVEMTLNFVPELSQLIQLQLDRISQGTARNRHLLTEVKFQCDAG
jgi:hypothetical protein